MTGRISDERLAELVRADFCELGNTFAELQRSRELEKQLRALSEGMRRNEHPVIYYRQQLESLLSALDAKAG